jgi:lipoprotein-releasing system permease protein
MNLPLKIARRYFFSRRSGGTFSLITLISGISLMGYIVGAAALVIVLSVFNGFEEVFSSLYNSFDPDIEIAPAKGKVFEPSKLDIKAIRSVDGVWKIAESLEENVLLRYEERQHIATAKGVDEVFLDVTALDSCILAGDMLLQAGDTNYAMVGQGLAYRLAIDPTDIFKRMILYVPARGETDMLVDDKYVIVPLRFLRKMLDRPTELSSLEIKLKPGADADEVKEAIVRISGSDFVVKNRFEQREAFFKVMKSEKLISYFILFFILLIAASNTIGSLYILVIEKSKDIRMLSSVGLTRRQAGRIFVYEGLLLAIFGGGLGILLGIWLCYLQQQYGFIKLNGALTSVFQSYPVKMIWSDLLLVLATVIFLGIITAVYPASKARRLAV